MSIFSFLRKKNKKSEILESEKKNYDLVNSVIEIPNSWKIYTENFRYKARNKSESIELSVSMNKINLELPNEPIENQEILKQMLNPLMDEFVKEGGYLEQEDRTFNNEYAYCSFLVNNSENHFHLWSLRKHKNDYYLYDQILKQDGNWSANNKQLHFNIFNSLRMK